MVGGAALLSVLLWAALLTGLAASGNAPSITNLTAACVSLFLFTTATGTIALAIGAATGRKGAASGITTGILVVGYLINSFKTLVDFMEPARFISIIYYYNGNNVVMNGLAWGHAWALAAITAVAFAAGLYYFERRDLA
jgi:ABC-2 type transport system permease protein